MLDEISYPQFVEWMASAVLDPWEAERGDWHSAQIVATIQNLFRKEGSAPTPIDRFVLEFDSTPKNTWQINKANLLQHLSLGHEIVKRGENFD